MQYAAIIKRVESDGSLYSLSFPDLPNWEYHSLRANPLFKEVENLLVRALDEHLETGGELPQPAGVGLMIELSPNYAAKLRLKEVLLDMDLSGPEELAAHLSIPLEEATALMDPEHFTPSDEMFHILESLSVDAGLVMQEWEMFLKDQQESGNMHGPAEFVFGRWLR